MSRAELEDAILRASGDQHPLDVTFASEESLSEKNESMPWHRPEAATQKLSIPLPESLTLVLANQIFITKSGLPQALTNRLIRLAAFQNPEFYKAQAMRFPVWNKPRIIGCAENHPQHIGLPSLLDDYGMIIVDECHHLSAFSFESILKQVKSKFVLGLTATPIRRDGHHPIIFMQCGPIRHKASRPENAPANLEVWPHQLNAPEIHSDAGIQDVFRILINDSARNNCIVHDILTAYGEGRKIIVLTERTDHPPLDTLIMAMPISWKGTLQQYAGRLHREHADKQNVRIYDYVETNQSQFARMWNKRQRGYCAMGYIIKEFPPLTPNQSESK